MKIVGNSDRMGTVSFVVLENNSQCCVDSDPHNHEREKSWRQLKCNHTKPLSQTRRANWSRRQLCREKYDTHGKMLGTHPDVLVCIRTDVLHHDAGHMVVRAVLHGGHK